MKKLLALVLCVMLFVSVIPTSAFAATSTGSAVTLYNAVQQQNSLYNRLIQFDGLSKVVGLYNGFVKAYPDAFTTEKGIAAYGAVSEVYGAISENPIAGFAKFGNAVGAVFGAVGDYIVGKSAAELKQAGDKAVIGSENEALKIWESAQSSLPVVG